MTDRDPREEFADLVRGTRRWLERERAAGNAELILRGLDEARARAAGTVGGAGAPDGVRAAAPFPEPPGAASESLLGDGWEPVEDVSAPGGRAPAALPDDAVGEAPPVPRRSATPPAQARSSSPAAAREGRAGASAAGPGAATASPGASRSPGPPRVNLFGEVEAAPPAPLDFALPPVHPPLHPIGEGARRAIVEASLPVLDAVAAEARACRKCGLCETRTQAVPGVGSALSGIAFVGEAPGADEDAQGMPFVGRAGQLLTQMIKGMDDRGLIPGVRLSRDTVFIGNVLKCRPPENRNPLPHEIESCSPYLRRQLDALKPRVICCLGKFAAELLVGVKGTLGSLRGRTYRYGGAKLIVTYHPAAILRNPAWKQPVWEDLQRLAREYQSDAPAP
uniref:Type-4 uracil-DNA glycosylase n=1 Tax=Eiseniibacteriota bacterium TaxID=2212470 RepID=A0A832I669_UNCEI